MKFNHIHRTRATTINDETSVYHQEQLQSDQHVLQVRVEGDDFVS